MPFESHTEKSSFTKWNHPSSCRVGVVSSIFCALMLLLILFTACEREPLANAEYPSFDFATGSFVDDRNGQEYGWVQVGNLRWMRNNLAWAPFDTDSLAVKDGIGRGLLDQAPFDTAGNILNGFYYNFRAATLDSLDEVRRGVCPAGWELPDTTDFSNIFDALHDRFGIAMGAFFADSGKYTFPWDPTYAMSLVVRDSMVIQSNRVPTGSWPDSLNSVFEHLVTLADSCADAETDSLRFSGSDSLTTIRECAWDASGLSSDTLFLTGKNYHSQGSYADAEIATDAEVDTDAAAGIDAETLMQDSPQLRAPDTLAFEPLAGLKMREFEYDISTITSLAGFYWTRNAGYSEGLVLVIFPDWTAQVSSRVFDYYASIRCVQRVNSND